MLLFRLAGHLGWRNVRWGAKQISSRELRLWQRFYEREPFGPAREDLRAGTIAAMLGDRCTPASFFPNLRGKPLDPEEQYERDIAVLRSMTTRRA